MLVKTVIAMNCFLFMRWINVLVPTFRMQMFRNEQCQTQIYTYKEESSS